MKCGSIVSIKRIYIKILNLNILLVILCKILFSLNHHYKRIYRAKILNGKDLTYLKKNFTYSYRFLKFTKKFLTFK